MIKHIICDESNIKIILETVINVNCKFPDSYWVITDFEIISVFHGDYSGFGTEEPCYPADNFQSQMEKNKRVIMSYNELIALLKDTETVSFGLLFCFEDKSKIDNEFHPKLGDEIKELPININSLCEISVFEEAIIDIYIKSFNN